MEEIIALVLGVLTSGALVVKGYFKWQGDAEITVLPEDIKEITLKKIGDKFQLNFKVPLVNTGKQNGMLMEVFAQPAYQGKVFEKIITIPRFRLLNNAPRQDWYWEAMIIKKNTSHVLEGSVIIQYPGTLKQLTREFPELNLVVHTKSVGRSQIEIRVAELNFNLEEISESGDEPLKPR